MDDFMSYLWMKVKTHKRELHYKVRDEISLLIHSGSTVEVLEWVSEFIPHFIMDVMTYIHAGI